MAILSEVWEKVNCKKHQHAIEQMLRIDGLKYISTPRTTKRGGGAAIVVNLEKFTLEKIEVGNPDKLEVIWGLIRPKVNGGRIREIICAAFYSPPKSKKNPLLLDHLMSTTHHLLTKYPSAGLVLGGDKNNLNISSLLSGIPRLRQIVSKNTYKFKILDVLLTNMHQAYAEPYIAPAVPADDPQHGAPSDHNTPVACPLSASNSERARDYITKVSRPIPDSGIREFGQWITVEDWTSIPEDTSPTEQVIAFEKMVQDKLNTILPQKSVKIFPNYDKPFITSDLKKLDRLVKREYCKHNKSPKYLRLKADFDLKFEQAANSYLEKNVRSLKEDNPGKAYKNLKKLGAQPGDCTDEGSFSLISHLNENLTVEESTERIANHFARISQEYLPLNQETLPDTVKTKLNNIDEKDIPILTEFDVYLKIEKSKKPKSTVTGDVPKRIVQEFSPEFSAPMSKIYNSIAKSGHWPKPWRIEYGTPLQKQPSPENEDHLRIIALTAFFSKVFERFVVGWLMFYVGAKLDWGQYGGMKGSSLSHYLIDFVNFILYNQDLKVPNAVLAVMIDFAKAFNRISHNVVITILSQMGVPGWLLRIVMGFLTEREMILRYKGCTSESKSLPGGGPQGTLLGLFLFLILINSAGFSDLQKQLGDQMTVKLNKRQPIPNIHLKYIDDMALAEAVILKNTLIPNPDPCPPRPLSYHDRTLHVMPDDACKMQDQLDKMLEFCEQNQMMINGDKTKVMLFNTGRKYDFMPRLTINGQMNLEVVEKFKLLGVHLRSDLKWSDNTDYICIRGYQRIWMLRRLKSLGANNLELLDVYHKQIRSVMEMAVPVWEPGLSKLESKQIERVQKTAFYVILGDKFTSYDQSLETLSSDTLQDRRSKLCLNFAMKAIKHPKYNTWFSKSEPEPNHPKPNTRAPKALPTKLKPVPFRTDRFRDSPLPYLTQMLNEI